MHTGARARKQKYISIYISLYMKTFLKTGVYIYIYRFAELDYLVEDIYCYSEFHAPRGSLMRASTGISENSQNKFIQFRCSFPSAIFIVICVSFVAILLILWQVLFFVVNKYIYFVLPCPKWDYHSFLFSPIFSQK